MDRLAYWVGLVAVLWYSWPALEARGMRARGVALAVFLPVFSWVWLIVVGYRRRVDLRQSLARERHEVEQLRAEEQHHRDVQFWRDRAHTGTPAEREAARGYLETLGLAVEPTDAEAWSAELGNSSVQQLSELRRHYLTIVRSVAASPAVIRSGSRKLAAVESELTRRGARQYDPHR